MIRAVLDAKDGADVARPFFRQHVVDSALRADRLELLAVTAREHCRHVAAVTSTEHADAGGVAERILGQRSVEHRKHVFHVGVTPASAWCNWVLATKDRLTPRLLATTRTARVAHQHDETGGCLHLRFVEIGLAILRVWAAVHVEQHRILLLRVKLFRLHDPRVDFSGATRVGRTARHGEVLPCLWCGLSDEVEAKVAQLAFFAGDDGVDLGHLIYRASDEPNHTACGVHHLDDAATRSEPLG